MHRFVDGHTAIPRLMCPPESVGPHSKVTGLNPQTFLILYHATFCYILLRFTMLSYSTVNYVVLYYTDTHICILSPLQPPP